MVRLWFILTTVKTRQWKEIDKYTAETQELSWFLLQELYKKRDITQYLEQNNIKRQRVVSRDANKMLISYCFSMETDLVLEMQIQHVYY